MASLNLIVSFDALIQDISVGVQSFGNIGVCCYHGLSSTVRTYEPSTDGLAAMIADGFTVNDFAYMAVAKIAAQQPHTKTVRIYRRSTPNIQTLTLTPVNLTQGVVYAFKINGITVSRANAVSETATSWCTAWQTLISTTVTGVNVTSTNNTTFLTLTQTANTGRRIYLDELPTYLTVKDTSADAGIATALNTAVADNSDFYGVLIDGMSEAELNAAAAWCETNKRILHGLTVDSDTLTSSTTDVASDFVAAAYTYSGVFYTSNMSSLWNAALMGRQFGLTPGSNNWENVQLGAVTSDNLTSTQIGFGVPKRLGLYLPFKATGATAVNATHNIKAGSGRFFDLTRDRDYFVANTQAQLVAEQIRLEKIPANQTGLDIHESVVRSWLQQAERSGIIDPGWTITFPKASELPTLKATRRYTASKAFFAYFQGAINGADISGVFSV